MYLPLYIILYSFTFLFYIYYFFYYTFCIYTTILVGAFVEYCASSYFSFPFYLLSPPSFSSLLGVCITLCMFTGKTNFDL